LTAPSRPGSACTRPAATFVKAANSVSAGITISTGGADAALDSLAALLTTDLEA
jgi:phosphotransferase system HPr-like phosphotransfer protein